MNYEIKDTYLAGFLMSRGLPLISNRKVGSQTIFCFTHTPELEELIEGYFNMTISVVPLQYGSALKILKSIIHQKDNNNDNPRFSQQQRRAQ